MSATWIHKLNESDSRLHKEDVIRQALEACVLGSVNAQRFLGLLKADRKSTRLNSSHSQQSRMPSSA